MRRTAAVLLAIWFSASMAEQAAAHQCPLHDLAIVPATAMAHHGAAHAGGGSHSDDPSHDCRCLEPCDGACALALPGSRVRPAIATITATRRVDAPPALAPVLRPGVRLPFANGPPHALVA
jgi:hypothetical protein